VRTGRGRGGPLQSLTRQISRCDLVRCAHLTVPSLSKSYRK
jgi:hypothetical protein